jgi:hypothetical protein
VGVVERRKVITDEITFELLLLVPQHIESSERCSREAGPRGHLHGATTSNVLRHIASSPGFNA